MTLRLCPDCENFHRGRAVVCRPCARERLLAHERWLLSRETNDNNPDELLREIADIMGEKA